MGLKEGDVVKSINNKRWRGAEDFDRMIQLVLQAKIDGELIVLEVFGRSTSIRGRKKQKTK